MEGAILLDLMKTEEKTVTPPNFPISELIIVIVRGEMIQEHTAL